MSSEFFSRGGRGLNVTVPHKVAAAELANQLTPRAERAAAVNTLAIQRDNRILGDNTDGAGLVHDLRDNLAVNLAGRRVLIVGAGGATRGVVAPLLVLRPAELVIANRTAERAHTFAADFKDLGAVRGCGFDDLGDGAYDVIINATSASLAGEVPAIPASVDQERLALLRHGVQQRRYALPQVGEGNRLRDAPCRAGECWWNRPPNRSSSGAASGRRPGR